MITILLITVPLFSGIASFFIREDRPRRVLMAACSIFHFIMVMALLSFYGREHGVFSQWFGFDNIGIIFLLITSILFFGASLYGVRYLSDEAKYARARAKSGGLFSPEAVFGGCFLIFLSTVTLTIASRHLAIFWAGVEATTLTSAPLIYFHRTKRSLEATWKYLLICSVGIAIALLGIFLLTVANNNQTQLFLARLIENAGCMNRQWLQAAFLLLFVGYATKMGLAPFHTWLPDAHSEAPSVISALLSGALLNCAFLGILRVYQVCSVAGLGHYCREVFIAFGLLSVIFAAVFILRQRDYKRLLAYSSVEHMGIMALGIGLGGIAVFGALINMIGHSLVKAGLFFSAGNILSCFKTKKIDDIRALMSSATRRLGILWMFGFLLITGTPPSAVFFGKFIILRQAFLSGHYLISIVFLTALAIIFAGMARIVISMTQGEDDCRPRENNSYNATGFTRTCLPAAFFVTALALGLYFPGWLTDILRAASRSLGGA
ncbi:MAG: proton-conducting transporter membrane subunit [Candidatus Omnitrophica bacterium]|jgi:hydrogenase-4 component F|nr:proton-conducting transporter membrane subunit [Candidatus Omnitrophota bacterium]